MAFSVCTIVLGKTNFAGHEENKDNAMKQREPINLDPSCELQKGPISVCSYRLSTAPLCLAQAAAQPDRPQKTKNDGLSYGRLRRSLYLPFNPPVSAYLSASRHPAGSGK